MNAHEFANKHFNLKKSGINSITITSAIFFAEKYLQHFLETNNEEFPNSCKCLTKKPNCFTGNCTICNKLIIK